MKSAWTVLFAVGVAVACGGSVAEPSTFDSAGKQAPPGTAQDPSCNTRSSTEERNDIPQGACVQGATCAFRTPAGPDACKPGVSGVAATPNEWTCSCDGTWKCTIVAGGYGILTCPGWEQGNPCTNEVACQLDRCGAGETCFTSVQCGAAEGPDAGTKCARADGAGDDTCHVMCTNDTDCPTNQDCVAIDFWGCSDFNGNSPPDHVKKICCPAGSNCATK